MQRLDQLEGRRRDKEEKDASREDRKKMRKIEAENPASLMAQVSKHNDPMAYRQRTALALPAPQVTTRTQHARRSRIVPGERGHGCVHIVRLTAALLGTSRNL